MKKTKTINYEIGGEVKINIRYFVNIQTRDATRYAAAYSTITSEEVSVDVFYDDHETIKQIDFFSFPIEKSESIEEKAKIITNEIWKHLSYLLSPSMKIQYWEDMKNKIAAVLERVEYDD